jgi:hypothetical protein
MSRIYISQEIRERVRQQAGERCGYCLSRQRYVWGILEVEHIKPLASGGANTEDNLWLACRLCNLHKGSQIEAGDPETGLYLPLFNPRTQLWKDHFTWSQDGTEISGLTPIGRATVEALQLNEALRVAIRRQWVEVGWHPPED